MLVKNHLIRLQVFLFLWCGIVSAEEFIYDGHGKKDPFSPPIVGAVEQTGEEMLKGVKLEGIIWDEKKPIAIINNKVVGVGDDIGGAKVIEIKKNEVIFEVNGKKVSVRLRKEV